MAGDRRQVKWLLATAYEQWRDIGLGGYTRTDGWDESWRGRQGGRNQALGDTLWTTGLRLREACTLLFQELPAIPASGPPGSGRVAKAAAKRSGRPFWIPAEALRAIDAYRVSTRAEAVRRAQDAGRYDDLPGIMIASAVTERRQLVCRDADGNERLVPLDALNADHRRKVFFEGPSGLEPASVWLTAAGLPMAYTSWQTVFRTANARCEARDIDIHCYPHMLRHSFALRWLTFFIHAFDRRYGLTPQEREEFPRVFGDPFTAVQMLLGHRSSETTRQIYLEPAQGLQIDLFLRDEDGEVASSREMLSWIASTFDQVPGGTS